MSKKSPQLRFEGFTDAWEERKLSSGLREYTDRVIVEDDKEYYQISVRNNFGGITLRGSKMGNKIGRKRQAKINLTKYPQTLIFTRQTVEQGGIGWVDKYCDGAIVTENMPTISLDTSVFSKYFLTNLFQTRIFYKNAILDNIEGGSAQIAIHESKFLSSTLLFPNLDEQEKIGQFFKQLDDTIDLHQRKLDLLKEQKKGYLQKMFPKNGEKVPELRFAGFADDWEERKLSDIADRFDNLRVPITASDRKPGDTPYYGANGIQDYVEGFTHNGEFILVAEDGANDLKNYPVQYVNGKVWVNNHAHVLQGKKTITDNKFLMNAIKNFNIEPFLVGGGRAKLNADVMMKLNILLPTFVEQEKIGSLFSLLDKTIALHQRKLSNVKELKVGLLQKMFPKNGEDKPEVRFPEFTDAWELRKSKELCTISTGKGNTQDKVDDGAYPFYVRSATIEKSDEYLYDQEAILTVGDGVGTGKVYHYVNGKYNLHQRVYRMYDFKDVSAKYFYYYFSNNFYKRVMSMTAKTSVDSVRMEMIADMNIVFPSVKEQENIVELFSNLDNTIALHQRKLDLLKEQKKGFLQKMFV